MSTNPPSLSIWWVFLFNLKFNVMKRVYISLFLGFFSSSFGFVLPVVLSTYIQSGLLYFVLCILIVFTCSFVAVRAFDSYFDSLNKIGSENFGLHVGMPLPVDVLNAWCHSGENQYVAVTPCWCVGRGHFRGDRKITSFLTLGGVPAFGVSGTIGRVYLRAEGFLEFMNDFNKRK